LEPQSLTPVKPKFDVVSVKPGKAGPGIGRGIRIQANGGRLIANNVSMKMLLRRAYSADNTNLFPNQTIGGPSWIDTDRFDVEGRVDGDGRSISHCRRGRWSSRYWKIVFNSKCIVK
jgi:uncharacterized protein (TIGR03435 family)